MAAAAVTPRVRTIVICDDVFASDTEEGVFNLEGVRQHLYAETLPLRADLNVFLLLSSPRNGHFPGRLLVVNERNDKTIRYVKFGVDFEEENDLVPLRVEMSACVFPEAGQYHFQVFFSGSDGNETLKGELPFRVLSEEP
ncbi:MAG: hypothetical protein U0793_18120 [Gemmataceae bacterium]